MKGWTLDDVKQRTKVHRSYRAAGKTTVVEPVAGTRPLATQADSGRDGPVDIRIHSRLKRLRDADGTSGKYAIDALVSCGILRGDDPKAVREVSHTQEACEKDETIIEIWSSNSG